MERLKLGDSVTKVGEAKISRKWQIAVIKAVRPWLKVKPGDSVEFHVENGQVMLRKRA